MDNTIDMDVDMEQLSKETEFSDFPDELLLKIFIFLNDTTLLDMAQVSKRFRAIAKETFKMKYNGLSCDACFEIQLFYSNVLTQRKQYLPFFSTFGENLMALSINFYDGSVVSNHWIYTLISRYCYKLQIIKIGGADDIELSKILHPRLALSLNRLELECIGLINKWSACRFVHLVTLRINEVSMSRQRDLIDFIAINSQLENITLDGCGVNEFDVYLSALRVIEISCKNIHTLKVADYGARRIQWDSGMGREMVRVLCKLITLQTLKIDAKHLKISQLESILKSLPNLSLLGLTCVPIGSMQHDNLAHVLSVCRHLSCVTIDDLSRITSDILTHTADVMQSKRKIKLKRILGSNVHEILITQGMVRRNGIFVYEKDAVNNQQTKHLLDLNDACLERIIGFLRPRSHCALYETCKRTRRAIETYYAKNVIRVPFKVEQLTEGILSCLGARIQLLKLDNLFCFSTPNEREQLLAHINQYCTNLNELYITDIDFDDLQVHTNVWPVLKKLKLSGTLFYSRHNSLSKYSISYETLRAFVCPMLTHLEILAFHIDDDTVQRLDHGDNFRCLTVLKFGQYNDDVKKFLESLDGNVCHQMTELSIGAYLPLASEADDGDSSHGFFDGRPEELNIELINIVSRFRGLTTLYLVVRGVDCCDTKFLFENCMKLITFGFWCWGDHSTEEMFVHIYHNCKQIQTIRLFGPGIFRNLLRKLSRWFPNVSVDVAIQNNVAFAVRDDSPSFNDMVVSIPGN